MSGNILFEVCCGCLEDAINAARGGADRIELNSALFLGGLSPTAALLKEVKKHIKIPVMCMVRPREGGFCYSDYDYQVMQRETEELISAGADGIVFGILKSDGTIDRSRCEKIVRLIKSQNEKTEIVFHRAIDLVPDVYEALNSLNEFGITRVLTSGQKPSALLGADIIRQMAKYSEGRIEILPGGGITPENVRELISLTGVKAVHASARSERVDESPLMNPEIFFGGKIDGKAQPEHIYKVTDTDKVKAMKEALSRCKI